MAFSNSSIVTEVVEIPLTVSFPDFLLKFQQDLLPVLLKDDGMVSVRTGMKIENPGINEKSQVWAISITEWKSLEAHKKFTQKEESAPFFAALGILSRGPPTIDHYKFSSLGCLGQSEHSRITFSGADIQVEGQCCTGVVAESLDSSGTYCRVKPIQLTGKQVAPEVGRKVDVLWYSYERKIISHL